MLQMVTSHTAFLKTVPLLATGSAAGLAPGNQTQ